MTEERIREMAEERRAVAERLRFFDAEIWLGRPEGFPLAEELAPGAVQDVLAKRFVTGGLVSHWRGKTVSPQAGNEALSLALASTSHKPCAACGSVTGTSGASEASGDVPVIDALFAVWTGLPLFPAEAGPVPGGVEPPSCARAVRIFPKSHNLPLADWCVGSLCDWLVQRNMPLFVWHTEIDWPALYELARRFLELRIVVETQTQKILYHMRPLFALMRDCPNILVETSNFAGAGFIEYAVREFGAERLVFGSFVPVNDPLVPIGMLIDADVSERDKKLIAGDNLRRLIDEVRQ